MPKIDCMYAFVATEGEDEGVMGFLSPNEETRTCSDGKVVKIRKWHPLVGADMDRVKSLISIADRIAKKTNTTYKILKFSNMTDITEEAKRGSEGKV